ncbi:MAG TPA: ATP-binding protein [Vicinamibacteria bacterium]|nr:ATP-binding protein [Vicinamibacteria bacterium]
MLFINRSEEMSRLERIVRRKEGSLAVVTGRRRLGKTRLLLEWANKHEGLYSVADLSSAEIQRAYFAQSVAQRFPGFADVTYRDWRALLSRLASEAKHARWRGPVIFDELPYLVLASPELPSVLQRFVDHDGRDARLVVAIAGSSQRMMQGMVLSADAPLYGRAQEILHLRPLDPSFLIKAFRARDGIRLVEHFTAWGGVPRYWELAIESSRNPRAAVERLVLDPLGPLHREPDRILIEEVPTATEVRPVLDAIGNGANRVSEIAARVGRPATSISRPLERLVSMGLVRRETPFGEPEKTSRRSLYKIDDPFFRLWFRVVASHRGQLASGSSSSRLELIERFWDHLAAAAWEDMCRLRLPKMVGDTYLGSRGPWGPVSRWWKANEPEWDIVCQSLNGGVLLVGEAKWSARPRSMLAVEKDRAALERRPLPSLPERYGNRDVVRALFVPQLGKGVARPRTGPIVVTASDLLR